MSHHAQQKLFVHIFGIYSSDPVFDIGYYMLGMAVRKTWALCCGGELHNKQINIETRLFHKSFV
jgi:hypothetical protein